MKTIAIAALAALGFTQIPLRGLTPEEAKILSFLAYTEQPDGQGGLVPTIVLTGVNLQIVNGEGQTHAKNGAGNIVIGYNETGHPLGDDRTGSHYLVFGRECNYSGAAGLVGGEQNIAEGAGSVILSGSANRIAENTVHCVIAAGGGNVITASTFATTSGAFIGSGSGNINTATSSAIVGGRENRAGEGSDIVIGGGQDNAAAGQASVVSGGVARQTGASGSWVGGMFFSPN